MRCATFLQFVIQAFVTSPTITFYVTIKKVQLFDPAQLLVDSFCNSIDPNWLDVQLPTYMEEVNNNIEDVRHS